MVYYYLDGRGLSKTAAVVAICTQQYTLFTYRDILYALPHKSYTKCPVEQSNFHPLTTRKEELLWLNYYCCATAVAAFERGGGDGGDRRVVVYRPTVQILV